MKKIISFIREKGLDREEIRYVIVGGLTTLVNFGLFALMNKILGINDAAVASESVSIPLLIANTTSISSAILFAYITNKLFVFKRHSDSRSQLALEFVKFVGTRLLTMALEIGSVQLLVDEFKMNAILGKAASQVLVVTINYIVSKLIVFRGSKQS